MLSWERPYRREICIELNVERYDLRKDGNIGFSHPYGKHDDVFWSIALAVYATAIMAPEQFLQLSQEDKLPYVIFVKWEICKRNIKCPPNKRGIN